MNKIVVGNWNNYYNRIKKDPRATISAYENVGAPITEDRMWDCCEFSNINFVKNDGVNTTLTINVKAAGTEPTVIVNPHAENLSPADISPDYLLVCDSNGNVVSRWFIIESHWNREWQFLLTLRRDLITDFWDSFKNEKFYAEKGPIGTFDILKYNAEGQTFNQVLTKRVPLTQSSGQTERYIIGYLDRNWDGGSVYDDPIYDEFDSFSELPFRKLNNLPFVDMTGIEYGFDIGIIKESEPTFDEPITTSEGPFVTASNHFYLHSNLSNGTGGRRGTIDRGSSQIGSPSISTTDEDLATLGGTIASALSSSGYDLIPQIESDLRSTYQIATDEMKRYNNKLIKVGGKVYRVSYNLASSFKWVPLGMVDGFLAKTVWDILRQNQSDIWTTGNPLSSMSKMAWFKTAKFTITEETPTATIPSTRDHAGNLPYDIFYIEDTNATRGFASDLARQYAAANVVYDIQVLPFKPSGNAAGITIGGKTLYWATSDSVHNRFYHSAIKTYSGALAYKKGSNLDTCRIISPDGASCWEFNPAKIGGVAENSICYEVTFAPKRPYIHIYPYFNGIYGTVRKTTWDPNQGESRGLVCVGDYSIPYSTNNWETYQINNSAYQLSHDRAIENMSVTQHAERVQEIVGGVAGNIGASFQGGQSGFNMSMSPIGAAVGAVIGGVTSLGAIVGSYAMNEKLRSEEMSFAEDMFGYQLQNIKAQAQPLAHSNYLTAGVAYFPYVELYEATSTEENIFADRLEVNGWTLGIVTTMSALQTAATAASAPTRYVCGRVIKFSGYEDAHVATEINIELQKGVRFLAG